jgi:hypothetical protein
MAITFEELEGSPRIRANEQGTTATRLFKVAWSDWQPFARLLVGTYETVGAAIQFVPPLAFPGFQNLLVDEISIDPFDPRNPDGAEVSSITSGTNSYPDAGARVTAVYRTAFDQNNRPRGDLPTVPQGTILSFSADLATEFLTIPGRVWSWDIAGAPKVPEDVNPGVLLPTGSFQLAWRRVPLPPWNAIRSLRGTVNNATFLGAPAGTVLFQGARASREFQFIEDGGFWRIEYEFLEQTKQRSAGAAVGWNYFYREEASGGEHWLKIKDDSGNNPYPSSDFSSLFAFQ